MREKKPMENRFFALASVVVAFVLVLSFFFLCRMAACPNRKKTGKTIDLRVETNKADLTALINRYLREEKIKGKVLLNDEVVYYGTVGVFSEKMQYKMTFKPKALKNGDLVLKQKSVSLGSVHLPVSYILQFVKTTYHLPKWVIIQPGEKLVYVQLQNMKLENGAKVKANEFDLQHDDISFTLGFPK